MIAWQGFGDSCETYRKAKPGNLIGQNIPSIPGSGRGACFYKMKADDGLLRVLTQGYKSQFDSDASRNAVHVTVPAGSNLTRDTLTLNWEISINLDFMS